MAIAPAAFKPDIKRRQPGLFERIAQGFVNRYNPPTEPMPRLDVENFDLYMLNAAQTPGTMGLAGLASVAEGSIDPFRRQFNAPVGQKRQAIIGEDPFGVPDSTSTFENLKKTLPEAALQVLPDLLTDPVMRAAGSTGLPLSGQKFDLYDLPRKATKLTAKPFQKTIRGKGAVSGEREAFKHLFDTGQLDRGGFDVDLTYSRGKTHEFLGLPSPKNKFDLNPGEGVQFGDVTKKINLPNKSQSSVLFDPPWMVRGGGSTETLSSKRFTIFKTVPEAQAVWEGGIREGARVLKSGGRMLVKIQDTVSNMTPKDKITRLHKKLEATQFMKDAAEQHDLIFKGQVSKHSTTAFRPPGTKQPTSPVNYMVFEKR